MKSLVFMILLFGLWGCGEEEKAQGLAGLVGSSWVGQLKSSGDSGSVTPVSFHFREDGMFRTVALDDVKKAAKGKYEDMPRHSALLLTVEESNFESFSLADSSKSFDYSLDGDELVLKSYEGIYTLVRAQEDGTDPSNPFSGSWQCEDDSAGDWSIDFTDSEFFGRRTQEGKRALNVWGIAVYSKSKEGRDLPDIAEVTLEKSNQGEVRGIRLRAEINHRTNSKAKLFNMLEMLANGSPKPNGIAIKCRRG